MKPRLIPQRIRSVNRFLVALALAATTVGAAGVARVTVVAGPAANATSTLVVDANSPYRTVTHVASGALYGLDTATTQPTAWSSRSTRTRSSRWRRAASSCRTASPTPGGDALVVAPEAAAAGAKVVVRMPDWYPNFPYVWVSWSNWLSAVDTQVKAVLASGDSNISAFELWNEPDWTWDTAAAGSFTAGWARTFDEVRADDPSAVIQGPSYSTFNASWMTTFLTAAKASGTVPNILSWHELDGAGSIPADVASAESIEASLGIGPLPIAIEEYGESSQVGIPGTWSATSPSSSAPG